MRASTRALNAGLRTTGTYASALLGRSRWPAHRFCIISRGRAGSSLLVTMLQSHPDIRCDGEILMHRRPFPLAYIDGRCGRAGRRGSAAYGFKILTHHLERDRHLDDPRPFVAKLHARGYRAIRLSRRDPLRGAISWQNALQLQATPRHPGEPKGFRPIVVDPGVILRWLDDTEAYDAYERLAISDIPSISLTYEADLQQPASQQATADRVCAWIGVAPSIVAGSLVKQVPDRPVQEIVANYQELRDVLLASHHEKYLP